MERKPGNSVLWVFFVTLLAFGGCSNKQMRNFNAIPTFSRNYVNAVIEIPAGTNQRIKYSEMDRMFLPDQSGGSGGVIDFLPCPGNYGFVPGTFMDPVMGGDGEPLKILVIAESLPTGTIMEVIPLLVLYFNEYSSGQQMVIPTIISVPASRRHQVINAHNYEELLENYPDLVDILIKWFASYRGVTTGDLRAMGDSDVAVREAEKWEIRRF